MPLRHYTEWENPPGVDVNLREGEAKLWQLKAAKAYSDQHTLHLGIYKFSLISDCFESSKLFPLVVALRERDGQQRTNDFYSFDNNGILLSHGYSRWEGNRILVNEQHDLSLERLVEKGELIAEMIGYYPVPMPLAIHTTVIDLKHNCLRT